MPSLARTTNILHFATLRLGGVPFFLMILFATLASGAPSSSDAPHQPEGTSKAPLPAFDKVHVVLLAGQSNMAGRGPVEPEDETTDPRIVMLTEDLQWAPAREPLHFDKPHVAGVGPGLAFARKLLEALPDDHAVALVPTAYGGTSIEQWAPDYHGEQTFYGGHTLYANAVERTRIAQSYGRLIAILWNQGEGNMQTPETEYREKVHTLIASFRKDFREPDLPFVAATLGPWRSEAGKAVNAVYLSLPEEVKQTAVVNTLDPDVRPELMNRPDDPSHYNTSSARRLGHLYAEQLIPLLKSGSIAESSSE